MRSTCRPVFRARITTPSGSTHRSGRPQSRRPRSCSTGRRPAAAQRRRLAGSWAATPATFSRQPAAAWPAAPHARLQPSALASRRTTRRTWTGCKEPSATTASSTGISSATTRRRTGSNTRRRIRTPGTTTSSAERGPTTSTAARRTPVARPRTTQSSPSRGARSPRPCRLLWTPTASTRRRRSGSRPDTPRLSSEGSQRTPTRAAAPGARSRRATSGSGSLAASSTTPSAPRVTASRRTAATERRAERGAGVRPSRPGHGRRSSATCAMSRRTWVRPAGRRMSALSGRCAASSRPSW